MILVQAYNIVVVDMAKEKVLVIGGGFAGVKAALALCNDDRFEITLLSSHDNFRYYPTLYHVATGGTRANASIPLTSLFEGKNVSLKHGTAKTLNAI